MKQQDDKQTPPLQPPTSNDPNAWKAFWETLDQPWRTEPEIEKERQEQLARCRTITPDIEKGIYPFTDIQPKLSRADVEWLLKDTDSYDGLHILKVSIAIKLWPFAMGTSLIHQMNGRPCPGNNYAQAACKNNNT